MQFVHNESFKSRTSCAGTLLRFADPIIWQMVGLEVAVNAGEGLIRFFVVG